MNGAIGMPFSGNEIGPTKEEIEKNSDYKKYFETATAKEIKERLGPMINGQPCC